MSSYKESEDLIENKQIISGHKIHPVGDVYHTRNTTIETHLNNNMRILKEMQNVYIGLMNSYRKSVTVGTQQTKSLTGLTGYEEFIQLMPGVSLNPDPFTGFTTGRTQTIANVLLDHHNYIYNYSGTVSNQGNIIDGRQDKFRVFDNTESNNTVDFTFTDLDKIKSLIAYYAPITPESGTLTTHFKYHNATGKFGSPAGMANQNGGSGAWSGTAISGLNIYKPKWFVTGAGASATIDTNSKPNQLYYLDHQGASNAPINYSSGNWNTKYANNGSNCSELTFSTRTPAEAARQQEEAAAAAVKAAAGGNKGSTEPVNAAVGNAATPEPLLPEDFPGNFEISRKLINCAETATENNILNSKYYESTGSTNIVAWDSSANSVNNMTDNTTTAYSQQRTIAPGVLSMNGNDIIDSQGKIIFRYCSGIVFRYSALFQNSGGANNEQANLLDTLISSVKPHLNKSNINSLISTTDGVNNAEYIQEYVNTTTISAAGAAGATTITYDYYLIPAEQIDVITSDGSTNLVPNNFCQLSTTQPTSGSSSSSGSTTSGSGYSINLYARVKEATSITTTATSECKELINNLQPRLYVMTQNKQLGSATRLLSSQYGNEGAQGATTKKWCNIRSTINIHAKHILAMTYLVRYHTLFLQRELQMMNYYQYGTVVYIKSETSTSEQQSVKPAFEKSGNTVQLVNDAESAKNGYQTTTGEPPNKLEPHNPLELKASPTGIKLYIVLPKTTANELTNEFGLANNMVKDVGKLILVKGVGSGSSMIPNTLNSMFYLVPWTKTNINNEKVKKLSSGRAFKGLSFHMYNELGKELKNTYKLAETDINEINKLHAMQGDLTAIGNKNYYMMLIYMVILFFLLVSIYYISKQ